jgi:hypothetical protein
MNLVLSVNQIISKKMELDTTKTMIFNVSNAITVTRNSLSISALKR